MNREYVLSSIAESTTREADGHRIVERRALTADGRRIEKEIIISDADGPPREYRESVRLYSPEEIEELFVSTGFSIIARFGSSAGEPYNSGSKRFIAVARRTEAA